MLSCALTPDELDTSSLTLMLNQVTDPNPNRNPKLSLSTPEEQELHDRRLAEEGADHERAHAAAVLEVRLSAPADTQQACSRNCLLGCNAQIRAC